MDRERLKAWLSSHHRTWRWNDGDRGRYDGVETRDDGLYWFRWNHRFEDVHGEHDAELQSWAAYRESGPLRPVPDDVRHELDRWVEAHAPDESAD